MVSKKKDKRLQKRIKKMAQAKNDGFANTLITLEPSNDDDDCVAFSFKDLQDHYSFDTAKCDHQLRLDLLSKLRVISQKSWNELEKAGKRAGFESLAIGELKVEISSKVALKGVNKLHVLRFNSQNSRLIGYRLGRVFHILFIDPNLELYSH